MDTTRGFPSSAYLTIKIRKKLDIKNHAHRTGNANSSYINRIFNKKNIIIGKKILYKLYLVGQHSNFGWYFSMN